MLKNYIRIAYRNLVKNQVFSFINILGLAIGMAAFLLIVQYIRYERSYEDFHVNRDNIQRVTLSIYNGSEFITSDCETYAPLGPMLKDKFPEVQDFARFYGVDGLRNVKANNNMFLEQGFYFADPSAFRIFTYEFLDGDPSRSLTAPFEAVLTESMARKYFGRVNVAGETIEIDNNLYKIKGVITDVPGNTHLKFTALLSRLSLATLKPWYPDDKWNNNNEYTYILTTPGTDLNALNAKFNDIASSMSELEEERFEAGPIKDIHLYSDRAYEPEPTGNARIVFYFSFIAAFIIAIAWVNYINLSTARAVERAREVGIRKVMGSLKTQLIAQFLSESVIINTAAGVLAFVLFQTSLPMFRDLSGQQLAVDVITDPFVWSMFVVVIAGGSLLSGIYPALVLSSFTPVAVLKGKFRSSRHGQLMRKGLVVFQFSATAIMIICVTTIYQQVNFLRGLNLGMDINQTLVIDAHQLKLSDSVLYSLQGTFKNELQRRPDIRTIGQSESLPGVNIQELSTATFTRLGDNATGGYEYYLFGADAGLIPTLKLQIVAGSNFKDGVANRDNVIINEEAAERLGFASPEEAIGSKVTFRMSNAVDGSTIIGVVKNYHYRSPKDVHLPMLMYYQEKTSYYAVKIESTDMTQTIAGVKEVWDRVFPNSVFSYFFLDEKYDQQYRADTQFGQVVSVFSGLTIFIACLGLFGLSSYTITQRAKEIGIRKVLGASAGSIVKLLSANFAQTVLVAVLMAVPISFVAMNEWLSGYPIRIELSAWVFVGSVIAVLVLAMGTVSIQTFKTAVSNPVDSLRQE
ncbi:MAG TPA: ABC transporter permease [Cyclobacteriaceae bacterium]|nr:ABC transporter permease [Cyclobacteriaceae bacterium]